MTLIFVCNECQRQEYKIFVCAIKIKDNGRRDTLFILPIPYAFINSNMAKMATFINDEMDIRIKWNLI